MFYEINALTIKQIVPDINLLNNTNRVLITLHCGFRLFDLLSNGTHSPQASLIDKLTHFLPSY